VQGFIYPNTGLKIDPGQKESVTARDRAGPTQI
jgi:hypothetical protein